MTHKKTIVVTIKDGDGKLVAIDEIALPGNIDITDLDATIEIVDTQRQPQRQAERNPFHSNALTVADLRIGMRVRVHYTGDCPWARSYSATVVGELTTDDLGFQVIPIVTDDLEYKLGFAADMGLAPSRCGGVWNRVWYTTIAD